MPMHYHPNFMNGMNINACLQSHTHTLIISRNSRKMYITMLLVILVFYIIIHFHYFLTYFLFHI